MWCRWRSIGLSSLANRGRHNIAITFDDCYQEFLDAAHVLAEFGLFFIPTDFIGSNRPFDPAHPHLANLTARR